MATTPQPTLDEYITQNNTVWTSSDDNSQTSDDTITDINDNRMERPETSTSSLFSYVVDRRTPSPIADCMERIPRLMDIVFEADEERYRRTNATWRVGGRPRYYTVARSEMVAEVTMTAPVRPRSFSDSAIVMTTKHEQPMKRGGNNGTTISGGQGCGYCRSVGYPRSEMHTKDSCMQLFLLGPCKICGATGVDNHTETYCPMKQPVHLSLRPEYLIQSSRRLLRHQMEHQIRYRELLQRLQMTKE